MFGDVMSRLFGGNPGSSATAVQPTDPNAQKQPPAGTPGKKPIPPGESQQLEAAGTQEKQASPLDGYDKLWSNEPIKDAPGPGNTEVQPNQQPQLQAKVPAYVTAAKGLNFARNINPELMTKALGGDVASLGAILDNVGRSAFAAASQYSERNSSVSGKALKDEILGSLPDHFKQFSLHNTPIKNPILSKAGVKPVVEGLRLQLATKFPDASTEELQQKAEQYFVDLTTELSKHQESQTQLSDLDKQKQQTSAQASGEFDWDEYFGTKPPQS